MPAKVDTSGGSGADGTYYGSTTTSSTPRTPVKKPKNEGPFPGKEFDWEAAQSGDTYQAPRAEIPPRLRIMPDGSIVDESSPLFYRDSAKNTQADWDYQRAATERFLRFRGSTGRTLAPAGGSTQPPAGQITPPGSTTTNPGDFDPDTSQASGAPTPSTYEWRSWTSLREEERELFDTMADLFKAEYGYNSTGPSWYEQLVADATKIRDRTGIAVDPANLAIRYAHERGYDLKPWLEKVPSLSPNSILFERGSYARGGRVSVDGEEDTSTTPRGYNRSSGGGGGYGGGDTNSRIDLSSPTQAQALLTQYMQATVGRDPKSSEVREFVDLLQQYQTNNPVTVAVDGDTVTQSGGLDANIVAKEFVETLPDYTEAQADRYYRTFMSALLGGGA